MKKIPTCKDCGKQGHYAISCPTTPRKAIIRTTKINNSKMIVRGATLDSKGRIVRSKPKKKANKTLLKKKLEKLVKDYVKLRDDYTCQRCGLVVSGTNCHASHVIPVSRSGYLQFDPLNMKVLCYHDHINWWHKHPVEAGRWYTDKFPERWEYLQSLHIQRLKPLTEAQLLEKIAEYKEKLL